MARILRHWPQVSLRAEDLSGEIDFVHVFGRSGAVHIEIGTGRGTFLLKEARAQPGVNFLGIERARKYYRYSVDRIGRWALSNVRLIRTDAAGFLAGFVPADSVDCFHIYFPDPWPKRRHHKRRFFCPANMEHLLRCLKVGGSIRVVTDHASYFGQIQKVVAGQADKVEKVEFFPTAGAECGEWVGTNFERKYLKEQRPIFCLAVRKKNGKAI